MIADLVCTVGNIMPGSKFNNSLFEHLENGYTIVDMNIDSSGNYVIIANDEDKALKYNVNSADYTKAYQMWKES